MILTESKICSGLYSIIFFIIAMEPFGFTEVQAVDGVYEFLTLCMFLVVIYFHLAGRVQRKRKVTSNSKIPYLVLLYHGYLLLITLLHRGRAATVFMQGIRFTNFALYVDLVMKNKPKVFFKTGLNILTSLVTLNCVCYYLFPNGLYTVDYAKLSGNCYLLGYDNQNINYILPMLIFVLIKHQYYQKCTLQIIYTYMIALITVVKAWSGMSMVVVFSTTVFAFFFIRRNSGFVATKLLNGRIFNLFNLFIINVISFIGLVFLHIQNYFDVFIRIVLKKSITLSNRTSIWNETIKFIKKNPIFGYGQEEISKRAAKASSSIASWFGLHAHNRFLETVYSGGLILLSIYLYVLFYTIRCLNRVRDTFIGKILAFGIFIYLMGMLTENYTYCPFFWIFMVISENAETCIMHSSWGNDR